MASENLSPLLNVSGLIAALNQTLDYAYPSVEVEGEIASFKVNQGKFVFFDIKDESGSLGCFMTVWQLKVPVADGMRVVLRATPKLTAWGKFSLTVTSIRPKGEGSIKKSFELLRAKLELEGLFAEERKRPLSSQPAHIAVISSTQAAGYADFMRIIDERWGGMRVEVAHVQVQGEVAAAQIERAIKYFNEQRDLPEVLVILRGGGSADDLAVFNEEPLVRAVAASRIPTLVGVGHETDETLCDLVADVRAATPSHAAQIVVPDRREKINVINSAIMRAGQQMRESIEVANRGLKSSLMQMLEVTSERCDEQVQQLASWRQILAAYDPRQVLARGYAIVRGSPVVGERIEIEQQMYTITAEVIDVKER